MGSDQATQTPPAEGPALCLTVMLRDPEGRLRLVLRCQRRPIAHIAAEAGVLSTVPGRVGGPLPRARRSRPDRPVPAPAQPPTQTPTAVVDPDRCDAEEEVVGRRIVRELADQHVSISVATVTRWLHRLGVARLDHLDVDGEPLRKPGKIPRTGPPHDPHRIKKVGRIPEGGGWRITGSTPTKPVPQPAPRPRPRSAAPGPATSIPALRRRRFSRLAYTEALPDETAKTRDIGFLFPSPRLVPRPRRHQVHPRRDRQRFLLRARTSPAPCASSRPSPADPALHPTPQRQGRALPAHPRQRAALRPPLAQRRRTHRRPQPLEHPLQLPSTPQRRRDKPPASDSAPRHQRQSNYS